jgi:hypothetical protein
MIDMNSSFDDLPRPSVQTGHRFNDPLGLEPLSPAPGGW